MILEADHSVNKYFIRYSDPVTLKSKTGWFKVDDVTSVSLKKKKKTTSSKKQKVAQAIMPIPQLRPTSEAIKNRRCQFVRNQHALDNLLVKTQW